jgi:hypothetical protein
MATGRQDTNQNRLTGAGEGTLTITRTDAGMERSGRGCEREDGWPAMLNSTASPYRSSLRIGL